MISRRRSFLGGICVPSQHHVRNYFAIRSVDDNPSGAGGMKIRSIVGLICLLLAQVALAQTSMHHSRPIQTPSAPNSSRISLAEGWSLQSSCKVDQSGEAISKLGFQPRNWYEVTVPTTVVAALVEHKVLPDPMFGMNLRQYPGVTYPIGSNFSNIPMDPDSPYAHSWWYRKTFTLPTTDKGKTIWLNFRGIN
jgi:hypothetical protein